MGLTTGQCASIQNNWVTVASNIQEYGNSLFIRYLTANPDDIEFFPDFFDEGVGSHLRFNEAFQDQTLKVMLFLSKVVACLSDIGVAACFLQDKVRTHHARGITMTQFERLLDLLPRFLQDTAGANGECADAWRVALATLLPFMREEFKRCEDDVNDD